MTVSPIAYFVHAAAFPAQLNAQLGSAFDLLIHLHSINERRSIESINIVKEKFGLVEIIPAITIDSNFNITKDVGFVEFEKML